MRGIFAIVLLLPTLAAAQVEPAREVAYLFDAARTAASAGRCAQVATLAARVRQVAPERYAELATDPGLVAACAEPAGEKSVPGAAALAAVGSLAGIAAGSYLVAVSEVDGEHGGSHVVVVAGYTLAASAFALGPSLGHAYAGGAWNTWLKLRLIGAGVFVAGAAADFAGITPSHVDAPPLGLALGVLVGGSLVAIGTIGDVVQTPVDAAHYNASLVRPRSLALVPLVAPHASGLALSARF